MYFFDVAIKIRGWNLSRCSQPKSPAGRGRERIVGVELELYCWWRGANLMIAVAMRQFSIIFKNIQHRVVAFLGYVYMACPTAHSLICGYAVGQNLEINIWEKRLLRLGDLRGTGIIHIIAGFDVSSGKRPSGIRSKPRRRGGKA